MSKTYEQGREEVARLCKYFAENRLDFFAAGVKEAHVRQSLIDPFFEALGWDMRNAAMTALQYREVIPEDSLEIEGQQKAPDYTFRVGTLAKFYTEAKKCGININADPGSAYQLRRYGWSAKVPLSILTDFEELGVYDCSLRPRSTDKASFGRIQYFRAEEYPDRWRELWDIFSREAVWAGAYDRYAASKRKRGTSEVDSEFLKEIEGWRDALARNIALRNLYLGYDDLNTAVQRTIDRIIFLRMAEDRGSESYGQLLKLCEQPEIYSQFMKLCRKADEKYNSGIFHFQKEDGVFEQPDRFTPALIIDDKVIKPILQSLYFENGSPYHFGVLPVEILGTVYERFLGKVIRLTAEHRAKVEEKPEMRKAGGVYYTPAYIVDYIVKNTVGKMIEGKSPAQLAGGKNGQPLRVLDMACGSGSFLLGAYQCLLDHCLKWYLENRPEKHNEAVYFDGRRKYWRLTITEKKRILINHIFGVDIDLQAVEVSKLSLLLKVLEGETDETVGQSRQLFHERALPNLSNNIKCGNSLIGPDYFSGRLIPDPEEMKRVNPFDWTREFPDAMKSGGFDCVIGNPPYGAELGTPEVEYLRKRFKATIKDLDTYTIFMEKALDITRTGGRFSMIVPTGWYSGPKFATLRKTIASQTNPHVFVNLPYDIFDAWVDTSVFVTEKCINPTSWPRLDKHFVQIVTFPKRHNISSQQEFEDHSKKANFSGWFLDGGDEYLTYADEASTSLMRKIISKGKPLGEMADIQRGVTPFNLSDHSICPTSRPAFKGTVRRYFFERGENCFIRFDNTLAEPKPEKYFLGPRILLRELISRQFQLQAVLVTDDFVTNKSMQSILPLSSSPDLKYLLGIINSKLMSWYFLRHSNVAQRDDFPKIILKETRNLPIRPIDFSNHADKSLHDKMVKLVSPILDLNKNLSLAKAERDKNLIQRQIEATNHEIDQLIYKLYGLTEQEIKSVEDGAVN